MLGDAVKRLTYVLQQNRQPLYSPNGEPTDAYWILFETVQVMLYAIGQDRLAGDLERRASRGIDVLAEIQSSVKTTPFDKLIPWTYRELARAYESPDDDAAEVVDALRRKGAAIMAWQAATRTDINKLTRKQVFAAVAAWENAPKPAKHVGEIVYRFRDGWTVQKLATDAALKEEGRMMAHCVGGYCDFVAAGKAVIFSLRDAHSVPRITMEWDPHKRRFIQIHGPENAKPTPDVQPYLVEVIDRVFGGDPAGLLMSGASLKGHDMAGANLTGMALKGADLAGAILIKASLVNSYLAKANLAEANLAEANLTGTILEFANLAGANLTGANLTEARLPFSNLRGVLLSYANLAGAKLTGANLAGAKLTGANLAKAILAGANLRGADLIGADLIGADLFDANLEGAIFDRTTTHPDGSRWQPPSEGVGRSRRR